MSQIGNLYVIAAPSGTGKTTLVKALVDSMPKIMVSISHTTRTKRANEINGENYHFIDKPTFQQMIAQHEFLEYATIFDQLYGTSKRWVEETLAKGIDVVLEIDWQGHRQIKRLFPHVIGIFLLPPSQQILSERLIKRNQDQPNKVEERLADARDTVSHISEFNYVVVNDQFDVALTDLKTIITAGRFLFTSQRERLHHLIEDLMAVG